MRKYITLFFSVTFFLCACKGEKTPPDIIDRKVMVNLLTEVHTIDGRMYSVKQEPDSLYKYGYGKYSALFKRYRIDTGQFRKSMVYYAQQPDELQVIYQEVLDNMKKKIDSLNKLQFKNKNAIPQ